MKNKKLLGIIGLGCSALLLTGCGGKKLTCTQEEEQEGVGTMGAEVVFHFDKEGTKVEEVEMQMTIEYEEDIEDTAKEMLEGVFGEMCEDDEAPEDCKVELGDDKFELKASGTAEELDYEADSTYDEVKEEMEEEGYTCK